MNNVYIYLLKRSLQMNGSYFLISDIDKECVFFVMRLHMFPPHIILVFYYLSLFDVRLALSLNLDVYDLHVIYYMNLLTRNRFVQ
jgi:hypothetical protein